MFTTANFRDWFIDFYTRNDRMSAGRYAYDRMAGAFWKEIEKKNATEIESAYKASCTDDGEAVKKADEYPDRWWVEWLSASYEAFARVAKSVMGKYAADWQLEDQDGLLAAFNRRPEFYTGEEYLKKHGRNPQAWTDLELYRGILGATLNFAKGIIAKPPPIYEPCEPNVARVLTSNLIVLPLNKLASHPALSRKAYFVQDEHGDSLLPKPADHLLKSGAPGSKVLYKVCKALSE